MCVSACVSGVFRPPRCICQNFYFSKEYGDALDLKAWKGIFRSIAFAENFLFCIRCRYDWKSNFNLRFREFLFSLISKIMWIYFVFILIVELLQFKLSGRKVHRSLSNFESFQVIRNNSNYISININYSIILMYTFLEYIYFLNIYF